MVTKEAEELGLSEPDFSRVSEIGGFGGACNTRTGGIAAQEG